MRIYLYNQYETPPWEEHAPDPVAVVVEPSLQTAPVLGPSDSVDCLQLIPEMTKNIINVNTILNFMLVSHLFFFDISFVAILIYIILSTPWTRINCTIAI